MEHYPRYIRTVCFLQIDDTGRENAADVFQLDSNYSSHFSLQVSLALSASQFQEVDE
jgi:hypothetical protein